MDRIPVHSKQALTAGIEIIRCGGIIAYPTDTLYGFGVDATNRLAIINLNKLKNRSGPVSVIAADWEIVKSWVKLSTAELEVVKSLLGGPTTVILPVKDGIVNKLVLGPGNTLGIRLPANRYGPELVAKVGFPITTTSINLTGMKPLNDPDRIIEEFGSDIDLIIDAGILPESSGSTIYKLQDGKIHTMRP